MLQKAKKKYTVETLKPLNVLYDHEHGLTQQDVDMANNYVELIGHALKRVRRSGTDLFMWTDTEGITATPSSRSGRK